MRCICDNTLAKLRLGICAALWLATTVHAGPPSISVSNDKSNVVINFTGRLQSAPQASGPFTNVTGATSPFKPSSTGSIKKTYWRAAQESVQTQPLSAGAGHTLLVKPNGTLWSWGRNNGGQLGDGSKVDRFFPAQVGTASNWVAVAAGYHSLALRQDGTLWAWGDGSVGIIDAGPPVYTSTPVQVGSEADWAAVACGNDHDMALKRNGEVWAWGYNAWGQLGTGDIPYGHTNPAPVIWQPYSRVLTGVKIAAGVWHSLAIREDGSLWAWGADNFGQLGDGTNTNRSASAQIGTNSDWLTVAGSLHTVALRKDHTLWACGYNYYGQLGDGTTINRSKLVRVGNDADWLAVAANGSTLALRENGTLWGWGANNHGQLGDGTGQNRSSPVLAGTSTNWFAFALGATHAVALRRDGTVWTWGDNTYGQLGDGTTNSINVPTQIGTNTNWGSPKTP